MATGAGWNDLPGVEQLLGEILAAPPRRAADSDLTFAHIPENSCYRNSAVVALFNLEPFLSFLAKILELYGNAPTLGQGPQHSPAYAWLAQMAQEYWNMANPDRSQNSNAAMAAFFYSITSTEQRDIYGGGFWMETDKTGEKHLQQDAAEFLDAMFGILQEEFANRVE